VVVIVGILALAAIPLITSNTRDARRSEGEGLAGSARNQARIEFAKSGTVATLTAAGLTAAQRTGKYFEVNDAIGGGAGDATGRSVVAVVTAGNSNSDGTLTHAFDMDSGVGTMVWAP